MGNLNINMKFYALLLAVVCIMSSVEANETFESSELASGRCKAVARKFVKGWYKLDTNRNGKLTWTEMYFSTSDGPEPTVNPRHGLKPTALRFTATGRSGLEPRTTLHGHTSGQRLERNTNADLSEFP